MLKWVKLAPCLAICGIGVVNQERFLHSPTSLCCCFFVYALRNFSNVLNIIVGPSVFITFCSVSPSWLPFCYYPRFCSLFLVEYNMESKQFKEDLEIQNFLSNYSALLSHSILMQLGSLLLSLISILLLLHLLFHICLNELLSDFLIVPCLTPVNLQLFQWTFLLQDYIPFLPSLHSCERNFLLCFLNQA